MRKLVGYLCHRASVRLHEAAVGLLPVGGREWWTSEPTIERHGSSDQVPDSGPIELADVAPRLAAAVDAIRESALRRREADRFIAHLWRSAEPYVTGGQELPPEMGETMLGAMVAFRTGVAAAIDVASDKLQHTTWLASIVGLERITRNR